MKLEYLQRVCIRNDGQRRRGSFVVGIDIDDLRVPVRFLARYVIAALQNEDALARRCQMVSQCAFSGAGSDNDNVVTVVV